MGEITVPWFPNVQTFSFFNFFPSFSAMLEICNISDHADLYIFQDTDCNILHNINIIHNIKQ